MLTTILISGVVGGMIGFCIAASQPGPPTYAAEAAELARIRRWAEAHSNDLDAREACPDGDDYNDLQAQVGRNP